MYCIEYGQMAGFSMGRDHEKVKIHKLFIPLLSHAEYCRVLA